MDEVIFKLTPEEAAIIAAECSLSLSDGRCSDAEGRAKLEQIMAKMAAPFGFQVNQLRALSEAVLQMKGKLDESRH